jgi:ferredoxin
MTDPKIAKVEIDVSTCIGCGTCRVSCPDVFREIEVEEEARAGHTGRLGDQHTMLSAAQGCPSLCITLTDAGGTIIYPTEAEREELRRRLAW